ncbi:MAG: helix-turn-helix domain-containing protein [Pseudonocardiaceae bacterium]|nr:helix-turn-helix domain-containing protein [Pseudonocardiaceae bacterium]
MSKPDEEDRQCIASGLRSLRLAASLSTSQLANRLGWSQPKVSKTELGQTRVKPSDVEAWALATGADSKLREELVALAERAADKFTEWRRELAPGRKRLQQDIQRMEEASSEIRVFGMEVVPGLAQTRPYVEAMFRLGRPAVSVEEFDGIVDARLARQTTLDDQSKRFALLMSETAVRRQLISASAMRDQIERLIELSRHSNISLGVIPFDGNEKVHQYHGFAVLGDPEVDEESIVLAETLTRAINIRSPHEIKEYIEHFEQLRSAALEGEALREFLRDLITA